MRHIVVFASLLLSAAWAQVPCEPGDREKDILVSSVFGSGEFEELFLKGPSGALESLCADIGIPRTSLADCASIWHRMRILAYDAGRLYELLGVGEMERYYRVPAALRVGELARVRELDPADAVARIEQCLAELRRVVGSRE